MALSKTKDGNITNIIKEVDKMEEKIDDLVQGNDTLKQLVIREC